MLDDSAASAAEKGSPMSAALSFNLAAKATQNDLRDTPEMAPIEFSITDKEGVKHELTAAFPPEGELLVFMSAQSIDADDADVAAALMNLLDSMFERAQYRLLRKW